MARKQAILNFTEWDEETFGMLQEAYPHKKDVEILRELMFQWRLRRENNDTKDGKLTMIVHLVNELTGEVARLKEEVSELRKELALVRRQ